MACAEEQLGPIGLLRTNLIKEAGTALTRAQGYLNVEATWAQFGNHSSTDL